MLSNVKDREHDVCVMSDPSCVETTSKQHLSESESENVTHSVMTYSCNPTDNRPPALLSMGFSRQEYWSGLPFLSPGDLPDPGMQPRSPALQDSLPSEPPWKTIFLKG